MTVKRKAKCHPHLKEAAKGLCNTCYNKQLWSDDPDKRERHLENRRRRNKEKPRTYVLLHAQNSKLKHRYGITSDDYQRMLSEQDGLCAICHSKFHRSLYVDHNHSTGRVRALLCARCNSMLGFYEKNKKAFDMIPSYLERYDGAD